MCHPVTKEFREKLYGKLMEQYETVQVKKQSEKMNRGGMSRGVEEPEKKSKI